MTQKRAEIFPDVPTVSEAGFPGFEAAVWYGLIGPAQLPQPIVARLHGDVQKALATQEVRQRLANAGGEVLPASTEGFATLVKRESERYAKLIREAQIKPD